jgi:hypothetical protein
MAEGVINMALYAACIIITKPNGRDQEISPIIIDANNFAEALGKGNIALHKLLGKNENGKCFVCSNQYPNCVITDPENVKFAVDN